VSGVQAGTAAAEDATNAAPAAAEAAADSLAELAILTVEGPGFGAKTCKKTSAIAPPSEAHAALAPCASST
jgi:hypothetical protein